MTVLPRAPLLGELATLQALTERFHPLFLLLVTLRTVGGVSFS
ncbi:hypothetical protein FAEPRAA2165_00261 [Faecalibacterium duncaniae]|uniref:Uncharacterized protein n=1 Tax=Faecalibacterium duncaniae (strain DSM 17677 / JCM 31915 / A2-165) TaxID=411483 RepID=C7H1X1_FAED2|nr:hypothetical protein FAEPRAA2165_00261 [Faecalibacterium duncaniae]